MIQNIKIDDIKIRLFDENQIINPHKIENTPHYKLLCGDKILYDKYYDRMHSFGRAKPTYMNSEQYLEFFDRFTYLEVPYENDYISVKKVGNRFESVDGDHRLSSLKKQSKGFVKVDVQDGSFKHKGFSNLIDIAKTLEGLDDYVVIKGHDYFPNYYDYDDLDILCKDKDNLFNILQDRLSSEYPNFDMKTRDKGIRNHIDMYPPEFSKLNFRFDLLGEFPFSKHLNHNHNKVEVKKEYFNLIFDRKVRKLVSTSKAFELVELYIWFPYETDDLVLRFLEWVWQPHKTRHIQAVRDNFKNKDEFIEIINTYTNVQIDDKYVKELFNELTERKI